MIDIQVIAVDEYISFENQNRIISTDYCIQCTLDNCDDLDLESADQNILPPILIQAQCHYENEPEYWLRHRNFQTQLESAKEYPIDRPPEGTTELNCTVLPLDVVQRALKTIRSKKFDFTLKIIETFNTNRLNDGDLIHIEERAGEQFGETLLLIRNNIESEIGPVPIKNYSRIIGNLEEEIIWEVDVDGLEGNWYLEIDDINRPFTFQEYRMHIELALRQREDTPLERIPIYFRNQFPASHNRPLSLKVLLENLTPHTQIRIRNRKRVPEQELFYPTGNVSLDQLLLEIHGQLLRKGLPVGPTSYTYQMVLSHLLRYRQSILTVPRFVDYDRIQRRERLFHDDLHARLSMSLDFGDIHTEVIEGNSRMDLLISTLPTELKIERNKDVSTADIFNSYAQQAADYVARMESYLGFLVVLDAAGNRDEPTPPARQDVDLVDVVTASGARLTVIGLVIRHPRSASDFSS